VEIVQICVTGATGFLGANLTVMLLEYGYKVRCLKRPNSRTDHLAQYPIEWRDVDVTRTETIVEGFDGCSVVFNCAGRIGFHRVSYEDAHRINVTGVEHIIDAARQTGIERLIHCSTASTIGLRDDGAPSDESVPYNWDRFGLDNVYSQTKRQGEERIYQAVETGMNAVIVNPCFMVGPIDPKPSSGQLLLQIARGKMAGYPSGANNFVDVRSVCLGMIQAWKRGKTGEKYLLGGRNLSYREFFSLVAETAGEKPPAFRIPKAVALTGGFFGNVLSTITRHECAITTQSIKISYANHVFSSEKAKTDFGYHTAPLDKAVEDALAWYAWYRDF
jgi:dihydroflavonol-4-reductase